MKYMDIWWGFLRFFPKFTKMTCATVLMQWIQHIAFFGRGEVRGRDLEGGANTKSLHTNTKWINIT